MATIYFEDIEPGTTYELGSHAVTREEIVEFASSFDPQPFHVDEEAAARSPFGGLIASGWHTGAMWMRLYVDSILSEAASMGSPGIEELRWLEPVRPGDILHGSLRVLEATPSSVREDRGTIHFAAEMRNQRGKTVMRLGGRGYFARRPS